MLNHAHAGVIAVRLGVQGIDAEHEAHVGELQDLVIEPADLGLFEFHAAQFFAAVVANADDDVDDAAAVGKAQRRHFLLCLVGRIHCLIHRGEDAIA